MPQARRKKTLQSPSSNRRELTEKNLPKEITHMIKSPLICLLSLLSAASLAAQNQGGRRSLTEEAELERAIERIDQVSQQQAAQSAELDQAAGTEAKKQAALDQAERSLEANAQQLNQPASAAEKLAEKSTLAPALPVASDDADPLPLSERHPQDTVITGDEGFFDRTKGIFIFVKEVFVDKPDVHIWCDELEVLLNLGEMDKKETATATADKKKKGQKLNADNVKQANARAKQNLSVLWRQTAKGEIVAVAREFYYDGKTGNILLKGKAQVLQNLTMHITGNGDNAQLTLYKNGNFGGPFTMHQMQEKDGREIRKNLLNMVPGKYKQSVKNLPKPQVKSDEEKKSSQIPTPGSTNGTAPANSNN
jgi:lipopolysaccharide export system protein LptA